jgi:PAS domain S-box-containing protein
MTGEGGEEVDVDAEPVSVVLVEDSVDVRTLVRMRLESSGAFAVLGEAEDGEQAIEMVVRHEPDLVLLDISMPAMDGLETLPAILAVRPGTSVVMFSGFGGPELERQVRELGALDLIEKSIPLDQLPDRLVTCLRPPTESPTESEPAGDAPQGGLRSVSGAGVDVADVADVEQAILDEHVEGFRALFDRAALGMATLTVHATIVRANAALAELMSCEPSDLVGIDYGRLTGGLGDLLDAQLEVLRTTHESVATFEHPIPAPPGVTPLRTALVTLVPVRDSSAELLYVFAQVQDITAQRTAEDELHRSEEKFRLLVDAVEDYAIFMLDTDGQVMSWNAGARRIKGYEAEEIVGRHFRVFYPEGLRLTGHPEHNLRTALRDGSVAEDGWRVRKDGSRFWASVVISAVHDERGRHIGFAKVTRDQTEQRQSAQARSETLAEQTRLLAVTAHELRNPTAVIHGSAHVLQTSQEQMTPHERDQFFRGIQSSADRLRRLAADLTAASQLSGPGLHFQMEDVSLAELVWGTAVRRAAASPTVHVAVDVPDEAVVRGDEVRLAQALDNLLDNAVRHGEPPFSITAHVQDDLVEISVTDQGAGPPIALSTRLFDRFATAGPAAGTGLGLYLVREIMSGHGGEVVHESGAPGGPTTFTVRFPVGVGTADPPV